MKILVLVSDNPSPPINGTRIRNFYLWPIVRKMGHEVKVLGLTKNPLDLTHPPEGIELYPFTRKNFFLRVWKRLFHSYHEWPYSDSLRARVEELYRDWHPDIIHAEELRMGNYLPFKKNHSNKTKFSVCAHNVESELIKKTLAAPFPFAVKFFNRIYQFTLKKAEKKIFSQCDLCLTYSEVDKNTYSRLYPDHNWLSSSNGVPMLDLSHDQLQLPDASQLLFLGSLNYLPNIEGLFWFLDHIYPQFKNHIKLTVAGSHPAQLVKERLLKEGITLLDTPLDLKPVYLANSLLLVPLLNGSGTRGKILESLMFGRPVLTTFIGVEGLEIPDGAGIIRADGVSAYKEALANWIKSSSTERQQLSQVGRQVVINKYTWNHVAQHLVEKWNELIVKNES